MNKLIPVKIRTRERLQIFKSVNRFKTYEDALNFLLDKNANR